LWNGIDHSNHQQKGCASLFYCTGF
jgi:hypothetical protein